MKSEPGIESVGIRMWFSEGPGKGEGKPGAGRHWEGSLALVFDG